MATHSSILAWDIPWTEEPGGLQRIGSQRVGNNTVIKQQQYTVLFFFKLRGFVGQLIHWLTNLFPQNALGQMRMLIHLSSHLSVLIIKKGAAVFCQHRPMLSQVCC